VCRSRVTSSASCVATSSAGSSPTSANRPPHQLSPLAPAPPRTRRRVQLRVRSVPVAGLDRRSVRAELPLRSDPELTNHPSALLLLRRGCSVLRHAARPADRRAPLTQRPAAPARFADQLLSLLGPGNLDRLRSRDLPAHPTDSRARLLSRAWRAPDVDDRMPPGGSGTRWAVLAMVLPLGRRFVQELNTAEAPHSGRSVHIGKDDPWPAERTPTSATSCT
jgi:hypothetical protein